MGLDLSRLITLSGYLCALLGGGSLFPYLPLTPRLVFLAGLAAGLAAQRRHHPLIPHLLLTAGSLLLFFWYAVQFNRHNPALPVASILMILLGSRLADEKTPRTWLQTCAIALFCLSASSLFDLGPRFLLLLALMMPLLALMLVLLTAKSHPGSLDHTGLKRLVAVGFGIPAAALLLTPLFFPILPRTQLPLWQFIQQAGGTQPAGLPDTVTPGSSAQVSTSDLPVFRAEMPRIDPHQLYWRGPTFSRLHGLQWLKDTASPPAATPLGQQVRQIITMEPGGARSLIGLDLPLAFTDQRGATIPPINWSRPLPSPRRIRYEVRSVSVDTRPAPAPDRALLTRLPAETPLRLRQLSARLQNAGTNAQARLDALERWFRTAGFRYSRSDLPTGDNALDSFLFVSHRGHCEFFASGFALLARGAGLPARLVGGYYGGEYNDLGGYYRVGEARAHVWVEVWIGGKGWIRVDPSGFAVNADSALGGTRHRTLLTRIGLLLDALDYTWNTAVITYDLSRQLQLADNLHTRFRTFHLHDLTRLLPAAGLLAAAVGMLWLYLRLRHGNRFDRRVRLLRRFRRQLEKSHAIPRAAPLGMFDIAQQTNCPQIDAFVAIYARSLYRECDLTRGEYRQLNRLLRAGFRRTVP